MDQIAILAEQVRRKYELEGRLFRISGRERFLIGEIERSKAELYTARRELTEHEAPSLTRMLLKSSAKYEEKSERLRREIQEKTAQLDRLAFELKDLQKSENEIQQELATLSGCEEALRKAGGTGRQRLRWRADFLCGKALVLLEDSLKALDTYRDLLYGKLSLPMSQGERWAIEGQANSLGQQCSQVLELLARDLEELGIPFSPTGYYTSPTSYIASAAAEHNRRERLSQAIDQAVALRKQLKDILEKLKTLEESL